MEIKAKMNIKLTQRFKQWNLIIISLIAILISVAFKNPGEMFSERTKCVSCERQFPPGFAFSGRQQRCFACEAQLLKDGQFDMLNF